MKIGKNIIMTPQKKYLNVGNLDIEKIQFFRIAVATLASRRGKAVNSLKSFQDM